MSDENLTVEPVTPGPQRPRPTNALRPLDRIAVLLPPEASLPLSERVYAYEVAVLDDPVSPSERDLVIIERLGSLMCSPEEVVAICGLTKNCFNGSTAIQGAWARGQQRAKARLRLMQWDAAAMGSERMLVHLGKQYLDQTEKTESQTPTEEEKREKRTFRDKLADAIDRAAAERTARLADVRGATGSTQDVAPVGEGQPTPTE